MCISQFPLVAKCKGSDVSKEKVPTDSAEKAELTLTAGEMGRKWVGSARSTPVLGTLSWVEGRDSKASDPRRVHPAAEDSRALPFFSL